MSSNKIVSLKEIDQNKIEDFDIILSKGQSFQSKLISLFNISTEDYSHIGIMIHEKGNVFVLHSTPDGTKSNGIRYDELQTFFDLSSVNDFMVLRYKEISFNLHQKLKHEFYRYKTFKVPFDYTFDNIDHNKIYCSELVWLIFTNAGLCYLNEFNIEKPIYPKYFLKLYGFVSVNPKKTCP